MSGLRFSFRCWARTIALACCPFLSGLLGAAVLYMIFVHLHRRLTRRLAPGLAASVTLIIALLIVGCRAGEGERRDHLVTIVLILQGRYGGTATMLIAGGLLASNNVIRPLVYRRVSYFHPMITLVGAFAGVRYFGLIGLLLGPLGIAYLFELLGRNRIEYGATSEENRQAVP